MKPDRLPSVVTLLLLSALAAAFIIPLDRQPVIYFNSLRLDTDNLLSLRPASRYEFVPVIQNLPTNGWLYIIISTNDPAARTPQSPAWNKSEFMTVPGYVQFAARACRPTVIQSGSEPLSDGMEYPVFAIPLRSNFASRIYFAAGYPKKWLTEGMLVVASGDFKNTFNSGKRARELIASIGSNQSFLSRPWDK